MFLGCDPDTHTTSFVAIDLGGSMVGAWICRTPDRLSERPAIIHQTKQIIDLFSRPEGFPQHMCSTIKAAAVEGQEVVYTARQRANPRDIIKLAAVAGGVLSVIQGIFLNAIIDFPPPSEWKKTMKKRIHQARSFQDLGWKYCAMNFKNPDKAYCKPLEVHQFIGYEKINPGDWLHVADALGIAQFVRKKYMFTEKIMAHRELMDLNRSEGNPSNDLLIKQRP